MSIKDRLDSIWDEDVLPRFDSLEKNIKTEVCVIGGGIAGLSTAYQLSKRGHKVTVVEAFQMGSGQTGRTTAHLTCQLEEQFVHLLKMHREKDVSLYLDAHRNAIETMAAIIEREGIECNFKRVDGFLFKGQNFDQEDLIKEQEAARKCNLELELVSETPLLNYKISSLKFENQAQFNPQKYLRGLIQVMLHEGVKFYEGSHVNHIEEKEDGRVSLSTDSGAVIDAKYVVVATDSPISNRYAIHTKQHAYRTYSMAFSIEEGAYEDMLLWDTEDPYHYVRFAKDTLVVGGEDHKTGQEPDGDPFEKLERWTKDHFSIVKKVKWKWSGQVFEPSDQMSYIGRSPGHKGNIFIATGFSGIGMTNGTIASLVLSDLIEGRYNKYEGILDPHRTPLRNVSEFVKENFNVAYQYADWVTPSEVNSLSEIPEDSGSLIRDGFMKTCVYHAEGDNFESKVAICSHLGGIVHWNDIEKTWDCPCHGSRFSTNGKVIEGPALDNLREP